MVVGLLLHGCIILQITTERMNKGINILIADILMFSYVQPLIYMYTL